MKNREWNHTYNVAGVAASTGSSGPDIEAPEGYYAGKIEDCYIDMAKNPNRIIFRISVAHGDFTGATCWGSINQQGTTKHDNSRHWRALYESIGLQPAQLDSGTFQFGGSDFLAKTTTFYWKPGDRDAGIFSKLDFLPVHEWEAKRQVFDAAANAKGSAMAGAGAPVVQQPVVANQIPAVPTAGFMPQATPSNGAPSAIPNAGFAAPNSGADNLRKLLGR